MSRPSPDPLFRALSRRSLLRGVAAGAAGALLVGCGGYPAEEGAAYHPWRFPEGEAAPERAAAAAAILASNPHNTQPWLFAIAPERVDVFADPAKSLGAMDPLAREMHLGLGCALENLVLAARAHGREPTVALLPDPGDRAHVARVELAPAEPQASLLYEMIPERHTNRGPYLDAPPPEGLEAQLRELAGSDAALTFLESDADKAAFRDATLDATRAIIDDVEMREASHVWYRHSADEIRRHRDGTTLDATGNGAAIRALGKRTARPGAKTAANFWLTATRTTQTRASAFVILSTDARDDRAQQLRCGRAYQRMHLWATSEGLAVQPLNQLAERQDREQELALAPEMTERLEALAGRPGAQFLFRIGVPWEDAFASPRRPLEWVTR